jgi:hypothetical protein
MMCPAPPSVPEVPFAAAINPLTRAVQEHSRDWVYRFGLVRGRAAIRQVTRLRLGYLAGRTHPRAPFDRLAVASDWLSWRFLVDGQVQELPPGLLAGAPAGALAAAAGRELPDRVVDVLRPGQPSADAPVSRALANLWRRTTRLSTARWQQRFAADLADHLRRLREQASRTGPRQVPEVGAYVAARRYSSGLFVALDIVELAEQVELPPDVAASPEYRALREATNDVVAWTGDIAASARDIRRDSVDNLVVVLRYGRDCSTEAALQYAAEMVRGRIEDFLDAERALPGAGSRLGHGTTLGTGLRRIVAGAETWMRGHRDWVVDSQRRLRCQG